MGSCTQRRALASFSIALIVASASSPQQPDSSDSLTLTQAIALVLERSPRLAAFDLDIRAAEAQRIQAGLLPNPELAFEAEQIRFGDGPDSTTVVRDAGGTLLEQSASGVDNGGFREAEFTLSVSQRIELGGKRARRVGLADEAQRVAQWEYEIARADVILEVRQAFIAVLIGQERLDLRQRLADLAQQAYDTVHALVEGGKITPLQENRAQVELAQARIQRTAARRALDAARYRLAAQWGDEEPRFEGVRGDLFAFRDLPALTELERQILNSPDLLLWTAEVARREAAVDLERARGVPDLTLALGWRANTLPDSSTAAFDGAGNLTSFARSEPEDGLSSSFVLGFSIPLPLFDRNQGNIREAEHNLSKGSHERREAFLAIYAQLSGLHNELSALHAEVQSLEQEVIPTAEQTYELTRVGFEQGKFPYLDVLDTQRTLFEVRNQYIEALGAYHRAVATMERFLGDTVDAPLSTTANPDPRTEQRGNK